jgi:FHS family L-fucose permease-like MFS transporter
MSEQLALGREGAGRDTSVESNEPRADASTAPTAMGNDTGHLRVFVFVLFFFFGGITSLNDVIIPRLKKLFTLSYAEVMTVQSAFFGAYFIISLPAAAVVRRIGYMRSAVLGLVLMMIGCLLFIVAAGITVVQVVARAFNSLGTTIFPYVGSA